MAPNTIKDLQTKVAVLERSNKTLIERLSRTEHKASQGLTQPRPPSNTPTSSNSRPTPKSRQPPPVRRKSVGRPRKNPPKPPPRPKVKKTDPPPVTTVEIISEKASEVINQQSSQLSTVVTQPQYHQVEIAAQSMEPEKLDMEGIQVQVSLEKGNGSEMFAGLDGTLLPIVEIDASSLEVGQTETVVHTQTYEEVMDQEEQGTSQVMAAQVVQDGKDVRVIHIQQAKYVCNICGSAYAYSHGLSRHMNTAHEQVQEHPCKFCGKIYYRADKLRGHEIQCTAKVGGAT